MKVLAHQSRLLVIALMLAFATFFVTTAPVAIPSSMAQSCDPDPCGGDPCCGDPCCGDPCCGDECCGDPYCGEDCYEVCWEECDQVCTVEDDYGNCYWYEEVCYQNCEVDCY
jgi:hypothetical protein